MSVMENAFNSNMDILQRWSDHSAGRMRAYHKLLAFTEHEGHANEAWFADFANEVESFNDELRNFFNTTKRMKDAGSNQTETKDFIDGAMPFLLHLAPVITSVQGLIRYYTWLTSKWLDSNRMALAMMEAFNSYSLPYGASSRAKENHRRASNDVQILSSCVNDERAAMQTKRNGLVGSLIYHTRSEAIPLAVRVGDVPTLAKFGYSKKSWLQDFESAFDI